jgi:pimeloyl-ACP methyl ester carboxylesterase
VVAVGGWGNGTSKIKLQHAGPGQYDKYLDMLERNKEHKAKTGKSLMVSRFDIVPIPEHLRAGLPSDAIMEFPADTAQAIHDFMPIDVIGDLAPRPLLLLHASRDRVTPTEASIEVFGHANLPKDMMLLSGLDHFPLAAGNARIYHILRGWLNTHFPITQ